MITHDRRVCAEDISWRTKVKLVIFGFGEAVFGHASNWLKYFSSNLRAKFAFFSPIQEDIGPCLAEIVRISEFKRFMS